MKYLKLFNESIDINKEELIEFCDNHLAYLIDIGFKIEIVDSYDRFYGVVYEIKIHKSAPNKYNWVDVNDDIIPFITILDTKYHLIKTEMAYLDLKIWNDIDREFSIEEIKKDEVDIENINYIFIDIARKIS